MRLHHRVCTLAALASLAAATAPTAQAAIPADSGGYPQVRAGHRDPDWPLTAVGAGGAIVLVAAGFGGSRAHRRRRMSPRGPELSRVS